MCVAISIKDTEFSLIIINKHAKTLGPILNSLPSSRSASFL